MSDLAERASVIVKGPARLEALAASLGCTVKHLEKELSEAGWHCDFAGVAWPPGQIEAYLLTQPDRAQARDAAVTEHTRRTLGASWPPSTLYQDILKAAQARPAT